MLKPIAPFIEYAINYDYISKVLCINKDKPELNCNGKCQLMKKIEQQKENDYKSLRIAMEDYPIGFVKILRLDNTRIIKNKKQTLFFALQLYRYLFIGEVFYPPRV